MSAPMADPGDLPDLDDLDDDLGDDLGVEAPEADTLEQRRAEAGPANAGREPVGEPTMAANEADVLDQHHVVPVDDREV
ncbi:MAG: hypothetical protein ACJ72N_03745 [Labedaea sp.]